MVRAVSRTEEEARTTTVARWPLGGAVLRWRAVVRAASQTEEEARRDGGEPVDGGGWHGKFRQPDGVGETPRDFRSRGETPPATI